jgi:MFS family permease
LPPAADDLLRHSHAFFKAWHGSISRDRDLTDKRRAWAVMMVVFAAGVAVAANRFKVPPVLPILMTELHVDMVTAGWLMSASSLAGVFLSIPAALLLVRIGLKAAGLLAMSCAVVGSVIGALATDSATMLAGRVLEGISVTLIAVMAPTAISMWFKPRERGLPMGIWAAWVPLGSVLMFNTAYPLIETFGWRSLWWSGALMALVALVLVGLVVSAPAHPVPGKGKPTPPPISLIRKLQSPATWLLALSFGAFGFCILGYNTWAPTFLIDTLDVEPAAASTYASLMFLAGIPSNIFAGWLLNRLEDRNRGLPLALLLTSILLFWSLRLPNTGVVIPYMITLGLVSNFVPTAMFTLAPETMPGVESAGLALASVMSVSGLGALVGPPTLGAILTRGTWAMGSTILASMMVIGALFAWQAQKRLAQA